MTFREFLLRKDGYERIQADGWRQTRWLGYQVIRGWADPNKLPAMEEIMPILGDPTDEDKERMRAKQAKETIKWKEELIAKHQKIGYGKSSGKLAAALELTRKMAEDKKKNKPWKKDSKSVSPPIPTPPLPDSNES